MAHVFTNGHEITVKNLGWLLAHSGEVRSLGIYQNGLNDNEATLLATGRTSAGREWVYYTPFASRSICEAWVKRPRFAGVHAYTSNVSVTLRELRGGFVSR